MKKLILIALTLTLSGCGFTPMHAPQAADGSLAFKNIAVNLVDPEDIAHDEGAFWLQQSLFDRLGTSGSKHTLEISPKFARPGFGVTSEDVATRYDMRITVRYRLLDTVSGDVLDQGSVNAVSTFGAPRDPYGLTTAEKNATQNVAREAADHLLIRLAAYYNQQ